VKTCPQCQQTHNGTGICCSRVCGRRARIVRVSFECQHCHQIRLLKPSEAAGRKFCSQRCNGAVTRNATRDACRKGGERGARARHANWWQRMMQALDTSVLSKAEAFREGYLLGYRRALNKQRRSA